MVIFAESAKMGIFSGEDHFEEAEMTCLRKMGSQF